MSNIPDPVPTITWKNTFYSQLSFSFEDLADLAKIVRYPYFCHHGSVYDSNTKEKVSVTEEDLDYYFL
ncbi:MAG: hypothetical protein EO766_12315 [Hydrotalea sp. AMD]|uniref:hypothetical protein n=1 Tax=Hydrotalea sp. AMD TaxID=2501297 RepID=UPI0010271A7C|nr:hypothetical protein [Hydrotalea sp. AMD]RWZ87302.1 MAG: hypothetical protein EO766_12315 [Hydrotalea sp. AMD]